MLRLTHGTAGLRRVVGRVASYICFLVGYDLLGIGIILSEAWLYTYTLRLGFRFSAWWRFDGFIL